MKNYSVYFLLLSATFIFACQHKHEHTHDNGHEHGHAHMEDGHHKKDNDMDPALIHTVFFWTKDGTTTEQLEAFEKGLEKLGTCPQIQSYFFGPPAPTENRDVVDNTYDFAINVHFASVEKQNEYQSEPIHLEFIENHKDIWDKVIVYDNVIR